MISAQGAWYPWWPGRPIDMLKATLGTSGWWWWWWFRWLRASFHTWQGLKGRLRRVQVPVNQHSYMEKSTILMVFTRKDGEFSMGISSFQGGYQYHFEKYFINLQHPFQTYKPKDLWKRDQTSLAWESRKVLPPQRIANIIHLPISVLDPHEIGGFFRARSHPKQRDFWPFSIKNAWFRIDKKSPWPPGLLTTDRFMKKCCFVATSRKFPTHLFHQQKTHPPNLATSKWHLKAR